MLDELKKFGIGLVSCSLLLGVIGAAMFTKWGIILFMIAAFAVMSYIMGKVITYKGTKSEL